MANSVKSEIRELSADELTVVSGGMDIIRLIAFGAEHGLYPLLANSGDGKAFNEQFKGIVGL